MTAKIKPATVSTFKLGVNNRLADYRLRTENGVFMRDISNADITQGGALKRRAGYTLAIAGAQTSLWSDDAQAYCASGTTMQSLSGASGSLVATTVTGATLSSGAPVSYATTPFGGAFWTDGVSVGIVAAGASSALAPPQPTVLPTVTVGVGTGSLDVGKYTYCFTYVDALGRESPATAPVQVDVATAGALSFNLATNPPTGLSLKTYISMPNGVECYFSSTQSVSGGVTITTTTVFGPACTTMGLKNLPAGRFIRYNMGRVIVAAGSMLYFSRPFMPGLYDPTLDFIPLPAEITVVEIINGDGMYVVADQTYWLPGDPGDTKPNAVSPLAGMMGSGCSRPETNDSFWMSTRGLVMGSPGGKVVFVQEENVAVNITTSAVSLPRSRDGTAEVISTLYGATVEPRAEAKAYASAQAPDLAASGETWVVDMDTKASRRYAGFTFTSYAEILGRVYGSKTGGIYVLEGDTDAGTLITARIAPGRLDFNSTMRKRMEAAYLIVGSAKLMRLTITDDKGSAWSYDTRRKDAEVKQQRLDVGRGLNGVFLDFVITNVDGGQFELAGYEFFAAEVTRRLAG